MKTSTSLADYQDKGESIEPLVNPEMTPTADMRKVRIYVNETHSLTQELRYYLVRAYHSIEKELNCLIENIFY